MSNKINNFGYVFKIRCCDKKTKNQANNSFTQQHVGRIKY